MSERARLVSKIEDIRERIAEVTKAINVLRERYDWLREQETKLFQLQKDLDKALAEDFSKPEESNKVWTTTSPPAYEDPEYDFHFAWLKDKGYDVQAHDCS